MSQNKNTFFVLGELTPEMLKIEEILTNANLDLEYGSHNGKELKDTNKNNNFAFIVEL